MMLKFQIRPASPSDVPLILELIQGLAVFEKLAHECVATEELLRAHLFGSERSAEVVIAEEAGTPVGFALFFRSFSTFLARPRLYLEDLFVKPEFRGRGYGRALLAHLAQIAVERGYGRFEWSVLDWNEGAIRLYRSLGAIPMSDWTVQRLTGADLERLAASSSTGRSALRSAPGVLAGAADPLPALNDSLSLPQ